MPPAPDPSAPSVAETPASAPSGGGRLGPPPTAPRSTWLRDLLEVLLIALVLYAVIWTCIETVRVDGQSMDNTLQDGNFLIASKISYVFGNPQRGDIVILDPPHSCSGGTSTADYVKRVVGLPGDSLEITPATSSQPGQLYIEPGGAGPWEIVREPYLPNSWGQVPESVPPDGIAIGRVVHIPARMYVVLGDNRDELLRLPGLRHGRPHPDPGQGHLPRVATLRLRRAGSGPHPRRQLCSPTGGGRRHRPPPRRPPAAPCCAAAAREGPPVTTPKQPARLSRAGPVPGAALSLRRRPSR